MAKEKFSIIESTCIPIRIDNCNTDLIIPARYLASTTRDAKFFGDAFMHDLRYKPDGTPVQDFVMNRVQRSTSPGGTRDNRGRTQLGFRLQPRACRMGHCRLWSARGHQ